MRLRVTRLEPRRVLNASPLVPVQDPSDVTADATAAVQADDLAVVIDAGSQASDGVADTFHIYRSGDGIGVSVDGREVFAGKLALSQNLAIYGSADADHLIVHLGTGGLPAAQIDFDGGDAASGHDLLELRGSTGQVSHVVMPQGEGATTAGVTSISYRGVEQLHDLVNASVRELRLEQMNSAVIAGSGPNELRLETAGFLLDMARPHDHFAVELQEGVGTRLHVHEFGNDVAFDFSVDADAQDAVLITGNFDFGHHDVAVRGGEIAIDGSIDSDGGRLTFEADSRLSLSSDGSLASAGGFVELNAGQHGTLLVAGSINVTDDSPSSNGGEVHLLGERVVLTSTAAVDASGTRGGGTILVGGDYQGSNEHVLNADYTQIARGAVLRADAVETGDGGRIIVWADVATAFAGAVIARGGRLSGNGGFAEVSGKVGLSLTGDVDLTAARGTTGVLLLDPDSISIVAAAGADDDELDDGIINAGDGGAGSTFVISDTKIESLAGTVILQATNSIVLGAGVELNLGSIVLMMQTTGIAGSITLAGTIVGNAGATLAVELIASSITISATGGITGADSVSLTADDLAINGPVTAATEIAIQGLSANRDINFRADDAGAALKLTNAELTQLSAPVISFATSTGTVIVSAPMVLAGAGVTWIFAGESFDVTAAGSLTAVGNITVRTDNASLAGPIVANSATSQIAFEVKTSGRDIAVRDDAGGPAALKFSDVELDQLSAPFISFSTASGTVSVIHDASLAGAGVTWIFAGDSLQIAAGETLAASAGNLTIRADSMVLNGSATAATTLRVLSLSATRNIVLGMNSGSDLSLTDAELDNLIAPDLFVSGMAALTVAGNISVATNLHLTANSIAVDSNLTVAGAGNDLAITAQNAITLDADVTAAGDATILANQDTLAAQSFTQQSGTLTAANVTIGVGGAGNASLADLQAGLGLVRVTTGGAILDGTASEAAALITAANAVLRAGAGIGGGGNADIDLAVTNVAATTVTGGIFLQDEDALVIGQVDGLVGVSIVPLIAGTGGNIAVTAGGTLMVSRVVDNDGVGGVTLTGSGITLEQNVSANGTVTFIGVTTLTTDVTIMSAAGGINFQNVVTADVANTHTLTLSAAGDINFDAAVGTTALQNLTITTAANVTFDSTLTLSQNFLQTAGTGTTTFSGGTVGDDLTLATSGVTFSTILFTVGDAVGDDLTITANNAVALDANVTVVGNAVISANQDDGGPQSFTQLSGTVLQAATITITVGVLNGPLDSGSADIALLQSAGLVKVTTHGGAIRDVNTTDDSVENIIAPQAVLRARAGIGGSGLGDVDLTVAGVAATTVTGGILLNDANALTITTVDGLSGLSVTSAGGGNIVVTVAAGTLFIGEDVSNLGLGVVSFSAPGGIELAADVSAVGAITFVHATNFAANVTVASTSTTSGGITFGGTLDDDVAAAVHDLVLSAGQNITFAQAVGGTRPLQNLTITAAANVTFDSTLTLSQNFQQTAGTGTTTFSGGSIGDDLTITTGSVAFLTSPFIVGNAVGDDLTITAANNVTVDAPLMVLGLAQITAQNDVRLDANVTVAGNAIILANQDDAGSNSFTQQSGTLTAANITIGVAGTGDASLANLQAGAGLVRISAGGAIRDNTGAEAALITADETVLRTGEGIGSGGDDDIDLAVTTVAARTWVGGIFLQAGSTLTIGTVDGLDGLTDVVGAGAIDVDVTSGALLVVQPIMHSGTGNIVLTTSGNAATDDILLSAHVTADGGSIFLNAGHDITQNGVYVLTTGGGTISYIAAGAISLVGTANAVSVSGSIMISANGGNLEMANASRVLSDGGMIVLTSSADVILSLVNANRLPGGVAGDVIVIADSDSSAGGAILDGRVGEGGGSLNIVAHDLLLSAATGIGSGSGAFFEPEDIDVMSSGNITAENRTVGAIQLLAVGDAALASVLNPGRTVVVESTPDSVPARHAAIATAEASDDVSSENVVADTAFLLARDGIGGPGASALTTRVGSLWASNIRSGHIGIVETDAINVVRMSQDRSGEPVTGDISLRAGGTIVVSGNGVSTHGSGSIALRSTVATGSSAIVVNAPVVTRYTLGVGGPVILQANNIEIASAVGAAAGSTCSVVQITPQTTAVGVSLGGETAGMLSLKDTELDLIATRVLTIGGRGVDATNLGNPASAGRITIVGDATPSGATHLVLLTNTDIFGVAGTVGVGGTLVIDAGTGVGGAVEGRLNTSAGTIVGRVRLAGAFQVLNSGPLTIGVTPNGPLTALGMTVPALQGIATANGSIFVGTAIGQLDIEQRVAAVGGASDLALRAGTGDLVLGDDVSAGRNVALVAGGSIFQSIEGISIRGLRASFWADNGDVGLFDHRLDVRVGVAAAQALMGSVYLHQPANPGNLSIGVVPSVLGLASIAGVQSSATVIVTTANGDLTIASPMSGFSEVRLFANGALDIANNVSSAGAATFIATTIEISDGALVSANTAALNATVGAISVNGDITTIGLSSLTAPRITIGGTGSTDSGSTTLVASSTTLLVDGSVSSAGTAVLSGFPVTVNGLVSGGTVTITAGSGTLTIAGRVEADSVATIVGPIIDVKDGAGVNRGVINAGSAVLSAGGPLTISGLVQTTLNATLSGTTITVSTGGTVSAGSTATFTAGTITTAQNSLISTGSVLINATAGAATLNGTVSATGTALISTTTSLVQTTGVIVASSAAINATLGVGAADAPVDLIVGTVAAKSVAGSVYVTQLAGMGLTIGTVAGQGGVPGASGLDAFGSVVVVTTQGAFTQRSVPLLLTGDAVGANALAVTAPTIARTGTVSLTAAQGSIVLAESTTARQSIKIETQAGDIVLGHRVVVQDPRTEAQIRADVSTLSISAKLPANSPVAGNVVFRGGYLRTPEGIVVDALRTPDPTPDLIEVDASRLATVTVAAGSVRQTVDRVLSDAGLRVDVDFRELREGGFQAKFASAISGDRLIFGPYSFEYSDEFLAQIFDEAGEEDSRFDVIITATQNSSIDVAEFLGDMRRVVTTEGTRQFLQPSVPLTQSLALVPVAIRFQPQSNFQFPEAPERASIFTDAVMPSVSAPEATPVLENADLIDITAASSGAAATDRPRLYLVWKLPGLEDQSGRKEFPIVVLAPRYLRALVAELPQGTYWFELQEPGADPRPIGEKFYVRGGRIDVEVLPEDLGFVPHGLPHDNLHEGGDSVPVTVPIPDDSSDNGDDLSQSDREHADEAQNAKTAQAETVAAAGASALGAVELLKSRWRRRFEAATTAPTPNLRKVSRLSRKIRRAAR